MTQQTTPETLVLASYEVSALDNCPLDLGDIVVAVQAAVRTKCEFRQANPVSRVTNAGIEKDPTIANPSCKFEVAEIADADALQLTCSRSQSCPSGNGLREKTASLVRESILLSTIKPLG